MGGFPGQVTSGYSSSPQIPADIWATPPVQPPPPPSAPRAPPGLQGNFEPEIVETADELTIVFVVFDFTFLR